MWTEEKMAMTWFLAVRIARSAGLKRWLKGGTYWILVGEVDGDEERSQVRRSLVVKKDVGERVRERAEERDNRLEGGDVGGGGAGLHQVQVNVPVMQDHEEIRAPAIHF